MQVYSLRRRRVFDKHVSMGYAAESHCAYVSRVLPSHTTSGSYGRPICQASLKFQPCPPTTSLLISSSTRSVHYPSGTGIGKRARPSITLPARSRPRATDGAKRHCSHHHRTYRGYVSTPTGSLQGLRQVCDRHWNFTHCRRNSKVNNGKELFAIEESGNIIVIVSD